MPNTPSAISRRTLAKGAAWTIPAISIAAAAPSLAASETPRVVKAASFAEKCPGNSQAPTWPKNGYRLVLTVTPASGQAPTITSVTLGNGKPAPVALGPTNIGPGQWQYVLDAELSNPSKLTVNYKLAGTPGSIDLKTTNKCTGTPA